MNLRPRVSPLISKATLYALTTMLLGSCYVGSNDTVAVADDGESVGEVVYTQIEAGASMDTTPGQGVGVFIEVDARGRWYVYTTCDYDVSEMACQFRVVATVLGSSMDGGVAADGLEAQDDDWVRGTDRSAVLDCTTYSGVDGMVFRTDPTAQVRFRVYVDGYLDPRFIYWVGDGAVHEGAPGDPIVLRPAVP